MSEIENKDAYDGFMEKYPILFQDKDKCVSKGWIGYYCKNCFEKAKN